MPHIQSLDGLRGLAVLLVILFHFGYFTAGWVGVQIFFVLSGFLITSILVADRDRPGPYFKRFYWRRSLRIFPLYFGYLLLLTLVFLTTGAPATFADRWQYPYSYMYNYALLLVPLEQSPAYTHFWSLAIEEQFYLLWPLAVYYLPAAWLRTVVGIVLLASPVVRLFAVMWATWLAPGHPEPGLFAYCPLPAQFDALATGAGLSLIDHSRLPRPLLTLAAFSAIALGLGWMNASAIYRDGLSATGAPPSVLGALWHSGTSLGYPPFSIQRYQHVWSYTAINLWSAALIVNLVRGGPLTGVFARRFLVYTGQISYGLYVFHYPVLALVKSAIYFRPVSPRGIAVFVIYIPLLYAIATTSFLAFEAKFLAWKDKRYSNRPPAPAVPA